MFHRPRRSLWGQLQFWLERRRMRRQIHRLLKPYLKGRDAFVPQPPQADLGPRCFQAMESIHPVQRVDVMGNNDACPRGRYRSIGNVLAYRIHDDSTLGPRREWIRPLIRTILQRRFKVLTLPATLYGCDNALDLLYFATACELAGTSRPELWSLVALTAEGNEPAYVLEEGNVLIVRCDFSTLVPARTPPVAEPALSTPRVRPVPA